MGFFDEEPTEPMVWDISEPIQFPVLRGDYAIGRAKVDFTDPSRFEFFSSETTTKPHRRISVTIYYPVLDSDLNSAEYVSEEFAEVSRQYMVNEDGESPLIYLIPNCIDNAAPIRNDDGFPVLLFSPGMGIVPEVYSYLFEELTSHGYIVVAIPDVYLTPLVEYTDGSIAEPVPISNANELFYETVLKNEVVSGQADYFNLQNSTLDMLFVLNQLFVVNDSHELLAGTMDLEKIGTFGHSWGGATAINVALYSSLIDSVAIYDSGVFYLVDENMAMLEVPSLFFSVEGVGYAADGLVEYRAKIDEVLDYLDYFGRNEHIELQGASHLTFLTDLLIGLNDVSKAEEENLVQGMSIEEMLDAIISPTVEFFDRTLK